ncbi:caspase family protein (plasmid) [Nostoc edaphicum CCNP1411]|uniref:Caspase family protein n=1 Tax=Nostoc edaphicum CCNP1411 TaxID=1472755 RepID=A0A7D7Q8V4_9NOSO|nr:caspase family protein [Nostoc edaphicum]QMS86097.1 caspase family protein [Nostoc edaphicum CCNP1411]
MTQTFKQGYAVVVGVGFDLPVTIDDATAIANLLCDSSRCAYPTEQLRLLIGEEASATNILSVLSWLAHAAGKDDTVIVYFSGHGIETPDYYLMPYGYNLENLQDTAILGSIFTEYIQAIQAKKLLVLLDCCHAGGLAEAKGATKSPLPPSMLAQLGSSSGRVVLASSRKDEVSWTGKPYSVFTAALLEAMAGYGAFEQDGYTRVLDLAMWVGRKVPERTKDKQHPIIKISNLEDNFALAWYAAGEKRPHSLPNWTDNIPTITPGLDNAQVATWKRMLTNYRKNLQLIDERMSEYVDFTAIPLQIENNRRFTETKIAELEQKLGMKF